jgi:hypothetical protein
VISTKVFAVVGLMLSHVQPLSLFVESSGGISHHCKFYSKLSEADDPIYKLHWEFSFPSGFDLIVLAIPLFSFPAYQRQFNFSFVCVVTV